MLRRTGRMLSGVFLRGMVVVLPIALTFAVLAWFATASENYLGEIIRFMLPNLQYWPGLGIVLGVALIFAAGILVNARIARRLLGYTVYLPKALVEPLDMSLEDAMRVTMSGGVSTGNNRKKDR